MVDTFDDNNKEDNGIDVIDNEENVNNSVNKNNMDVTIIFLGICNYCQC